MPNNASHKKRLRQSEVRRHRNREVRSEIRTRTKKLLAMDSADDAQSAMSELYTALDRAARKNIMPPNAAARQKARLARHVNSLTG
ncbi:MAG: 30S ribosomal protein S20 [Gemmatimonadota bacterium]|nr:30S ribosomal protein S20 [Gemmatimonadota bacterium]